MNEQRKPKDVKKSWAKPKMRRKKNNRCWMAVARVENRGRLRTKREDKERERTLGREERMRKIRENGRMLERKQWTKERKGRKES